MGQVALLEEFLERQYGLPSIFFGTGVLPNALSVLRVLVFLLASASEILVV